MIDRCFLGCRIRLSGGKVALVDPGDWVKLNRKNWKAKLARGGWYAIRTTVVNGRKKYTYMHRLIMNTPKEEICHHRNGNGLDNRKLNLENMAPTEHDQLSRMRRIARKKRVI